MRDLPKILSAVFALSLPAISFAGVTTPFPNPAPGAGVTLEDYIYLLITLMQWILIPVMVICMVYGGFLFVTSGGNEDQLKKGKTWFIWNFVGATIMLGAKVIAQAIFTTAGGL